MSDGIQLFIILFVVFVMFSIINFLAISLSQHSFKRRVLAGFIFLLLMPIIFLTITALTSILDNAGLGAINLTSSIVNVYILNGIVILLSASFILKKQNIR
ncbi:MULTISPECIES: hypothetical protein [Bacillus]|jgi:phosphoglycerol transferase MdoB-like AlkP superfamily enzyme|uniref:Uncharacterized protein n=1 Tax=Bacillus pacificus TaxID=2026187 RepID=A0AAP4CKH3_9BACI|nr:MULTISPECIES: hypothetical protein [Bacillus]KMQ27367.1 hypothetical protein TU53_26175 [Bacillus cereus]KXY75793.1 hypothetical protein AT272_20865 [Bacillus cereus]MCU5159566.1 hypothetical protein [Bacillus pacificus]MCU9943820.1 hypothetical protein [Bacillus pacificus]MCX3302343.1 hypothetical protein [Bacillus pacificus]